MLRIALFSMAVVAYGEAEACRFAESLDPTGIELFEQPCAAEDWNANARVAGVSTVSAGAATLTRK